jgi:hypothetical protein
LNRQLAVLKPHDFCGGRAFFSEPTCHRHRQEKVVMVSLTPALEVFRPRRWRPHLEVLQLIDELLRFRPLGKSDSFCLQERLDYTSKFKLGYVLASIIPMDCLPHGQRDGSNVGEAV